MKKLQVIILFATATIFIASCVQTENNKDADNKGSLSTEEIKKDTVPVKTEISYSEIIEKSSDDYLLRVTTEDASKYVDKAGKTIIGENDYLMCLTDTFRNYALVLSQEKGFIAINRDKKIIYDLFVFDNGPDYTSEGLFRIMKNKKIGYADSITGKIVIEPEYQGAYPFENEKAQVTVKCKTINDQEHTTWESDSWIYIDKTGKIINE